MLNRFALDRLLLLCIFATGFSGVVSEYLMATLASYLIGDSITQWALTISVMLFFMGIGSQLSAQIKGQPLTNFIICELILSLVISVSPSIVYGLAPFTENLTVVIYLLTSLMGLLVGAEIPLASQVLSQTMTLKKNIAWVLSQDYFGALVGGIFFVFIGQSFLGLAYTAVLLGCINFIIALSLLRFFPKWPFLVLATILMIHGFYSQKIMVYGEQSRYKDLIIYSEQSRYQKIVITQWKDDYWLYLNGNEQFSTVDEYKYHESLVHPALSTSQTRNHVLILGGGDGLAAREVFKYFPEVKTITLVDLDPRMTTLARQHPVLRQINENAMNQKKLQVINEDAFAFLKKTSDRFDAVLIDLPDPKTVSLARLYTKEFYKLLRKQMNHGACLTTQALSPQFVPQAFWSIEKSLVSAGFQTIPYWINMPTLGEWGFVMGCISHYGDNLSHKFLNTKIDNGFRFLDHEQLLAMKIFSKDVKYYKKESKPSSLSNLNIYYYYKNGRWDLY